MTAWEDPDMVSDFLVEAEEHLDEADAVLLDLEATPRDAELQRRLNGPLHTLKGMASYVDFTEIGQLCHVTESLVGTLTTQPDTEVGHTIECAFQAVARMRSYFADVSDSLEADGGVPDAGAIRELRTRIEARLPGAQRQAM